MLKEYAGVITRFLRPDERLMLSEETDMPLVIEANGRTHADFLQALLSTHSADILADVAQYGAVLFRGFDIHSDETFEKTMLTIQGFHAISEAFMSEEGRIHVGDLKYILHTNAVYKTGGTLYLGGFHSENYYSADVPSYIAFCCLTPSTQGGETGLVNMEKIYQHLDNSLKQRLEENSFFVSKWLISEVAERYQLPVDKVTEICTHFNLPMIGQDDEKFVLMYKPSVFEHPLTHQKSMQINLFEILTLNTEMRKCFMSDYQGKSWFWHRFIWHLPASVFKLIEKIYIMLASFFYSPKNSLTILRTKFATYKASRKKIPLPDFNSKKVGHCFNDKDVKALAKLIRAYYSSCLWKKGDILFVDNRKVMHAGMPGKGPRLIRAMIGNSIDMNYSFQESGVINCKERAGETIGSAMKLGNEYKIPPMTSAQSH